MRDCGRATVDGGHGWEAAGEKKEIKKQEIISEKNGSFG